MTDPRPVFVIEKKSNSVLNILMRFSVEPYRNGIALVGTDSFRDPKTNDRYRTMSSTIGSVQVYSNRCVWHYLGDSIHGRHKGGFESFDEVKKFAVNKFIQITRSYLKTEFPQAPKLTREEARQIRAHLREGIEEMEKE